MLCIETSGLHHRFSNGQVAVDQLSMQVPVGSIYGFLGPNGAGKTTTLRLLLGLLKRQEGEVRFFGQSMSGNRVRTLAGIGSMIETPSVYGHLSARDNLRIWTDYFNCPKNRIDEVLEIVGLTDTAKKKAYAFSLGMKQRLGIAIALLHKPGVLILDEPTNGLDPTGIIEIRDLLKRLNKEEQITILVSSHILAEVEKLVSHVGIINHGKLLFQGTFSDLLSKEKQGILLETGNNILAIQLLREKNILAELSGDELLLPVLDPRSRAEIIDFLVAAKVPVYRLEQRGKNLETIFMDMIK